MTIKEPFRSKLIAELEKRTYKDPNTGCFIWNGHISRTSGHGRICLSEFRQYVHRLAMALFRDFDLDSEADICHKLSCSTPSCWNVDHLYIGTHYTNMQDRFTKYGGRYGSSSKYYTVGKNNGH